MKVSCIVITTNLSHRLQLLDDAIMSIERSNNNFLDYKTLSIDVIKGSAFDINYFKKYQDMGWNLATGKCSVKRGMYNNIVRGLNNIEDSDYIYYCEDDVIINRLPDKNSLEQLFFNKTANNKKIGYACFNTHISDDPLNKDKINFINNVNNYQKFGDELFLIKNKDILMDEYFLNFPSAIVNAHVFKSLIEYSGEVCSGIGMETGLSKSWFDLEFDKHFDTAVYVKPETINNLPMSLDKFHYMSNMEFWNNNDKLRHPPINGRKNTIF